MTGRLTVAALAVGLLTSCSSSGDDTAVVVQECKDAVQAHLNYDADFPFLEPTPDKDAAGTWHVSGTVTAQNGFGAKRTLHWTCTVDNNDDVNVNLDA